MKGLIQISPGIYKDAHGMYYLCASVLLPMCGLAVYPETEEDLRVALETLLREMGHPEIKGFQILKSHLNGRC